MTEIFFYHLHTQSLDKALGHLLQRALARGLRVVVRAGSAERVEALNDSLWTFDRESFIPHGSRQDGGAERQPVWLTEREENPNGASLLLLLDGAEGSLEGYARVCDLFDGRDQAAHAAAKARWDRLKEKGLTPVYWRQDDAGRWRQDAGPG
jgi:DNA polymerase-3 subunit chi